MESIYLDYAATAPLRPEARAAMAPFLDDRFGNPASTHRQGREARVALDEARERVAGLLGAKPKEIIFTSGGTESNNLVLHGVAASGRGPIALSAIEHSSVRGPGAFLARQGREVVEIPVAPAGVVEPQGVEEALRAAAPTLLSLMRVNNESGAIQPVQEIAERLKARGVVIHSDMVQALGKMPIDLGSSAIDLASFSAHKIGGPRGVGALYLREGVEIDPPYRGGGQESGLRPGTVNVAGAVGFAAALTCSEQSREEEIRRLGALRDRLERRMVDEIGGVINAAGAPRVASISSIRVAGVPRDALLMSLDLEGVAVSSGSACASGGTEPSRVLMAMGVGDEAAGPTVRVSMGWRTTEKEVDRAADALVRVVARLRELESA